MCQIRGFLTSSVTATDHGNDFLAIEETVAGGTGADTLTVVFLFIVQPQIFGTGTGSDDDRVGFEFIIAVGRQPIGTFREVGFHDDAVANIGTETLRLLTKLHHHLVGIHPFGIAGEVLNDGCLRQLTTHLQSAIEYGVDVGTSGVDGGSVTGRSAADYQTFNVFHITSLLGILSFQQFNNLLLDILYLLCRFETSNDLSLLVDKEFGEVPFDV